MKAAALILSLALATSAGATTYRGKVWSYYAPGALLFRTVVYPTSSAGLYTGTARCVPVSGRAHCLARQASVAVAFTPDGQFTGSFGGICDATGIGNPYTGALAGSYECANGDAGSFYWRRVR
jgi:hypothetical protein